jgi:probable rRNA maturation factor
VNAFDVEVTTLWETAAPLTIKEATIKALVRHTLAAERANGVWSISVVLSTDQHLRALHREFMGLDSPTDIMTFPYRVDASPVEADDQRSVLGGDIVISVERAAANAEDEGWDTASEVEFLISHGVLHLVGWEDGEPAQRRAMLNRQRELLQSFHHINARQIRPRV